MIFNKYFHSSLSSDDLRIDIAEFSYVLYLVFDWIHIFITKEQQAKLNFVRTKIKICHDIFDKFVNVVLVVFGIICLFPAIIMNRNRGINNQ